MHGYSIKWHWQKKESTVLQSVLTWENLLCSFSFLQADLREDIRHSVNRLEVHDPNPRALVFSLSCASGHSEKASVSSEAHRLFSFIWDDMSCLCPRCNTSDAAHPDCPGGHCGVASDPSSHQQYPGQLPSAARQPLHLEERVSGGDGEVRG